MSVHPPIRNATARLQTALAHLLPPTLRTDIVDFDIGFATHTGSADPRRLLVDVKSGWPALDPIAPTQYLGPEVLTGGVWVVVQANQSLRLRVSCMPGATAVASAIAFDAIE